MLFTRSATALVIATLVATGCSSSKSNKNKSGGGGSVAITLKSGHLVGPDGKTLYYNTVDTASKIQCTGGCASIWPPLLGTPKPGNGLDEGDFKTTSRPGGGAQVTYYGHPLYEFASDSASSMKGQGIADAGGKWVVATPDQASSGGNQSSSSEESSSSSSGGYGGY